MRQFGREIAQFNFKAKAPEKAGSWPSVRRDRKSSPAQPANAAKTASQSASRSVFPAFGRTINSGELIRILFDFLPAAVSGTCFLPVRRIKKRLQAVSDLAEDQHFIRQELNRLNLVSFVADGAVLARESGISSRPMKSCVPFRSPESLQVTP